MPLTSQSIRYAILYYACNTNTTEKVSESAIYTMNPSHLHAPSHTGIDHAIDSADPARIPQTPVPTAHLPSTAEEGSLGYPQSAPSFR